LLYIFDEAVREIEIIEEDKIEISFPSTEVKNEILSCKSTEDDSDHLILFLFDVLKYEKKRSTITITSMIRDLVILRKNAL